MQVAAALAVVLLAVTCGCSRSSPTARTGAPVCSELVPMAVRFLEPEQRRPYFVECGGAVFHPEGDLVDRQLSDAACKLDGCWTWTISVTGSDEGVLRGVKKPPENSGRLGALLVMAIQWERSDEGLKVIRMRVVERS